MKQEEKNKISKDKILNAAIVEFGTKNYGDASLNNICNDNNISKGLIYHYYKNKDDLFLSCVKYCFDEFVDYLQSEECGQNDQNDFQSIMQKYLNLRYDFLKDNIYLSHIFFNVVLQPPMHLKQEIKALRKNFDNLNISTYRFALSKITLREGITEEEAIEYFWIFQEMFNGYFESKAYENCDFNGLIKAHEINIGKILNIMIYGIAKED
ncbi:TetR/AcrR family transcriptional regulator [uncultured Clostridium sp.]|uniref:TetR/AcrR family transcriptional regulator n=1 Tax=uncultured Clostridium sp. TaxID=59620 RepID=UPI0028E199EA|nr:TetR/AcrR family transcriptional regulator [uncultured Clostridium sp.]